MRRSVDGGKRCADLDANARKVISDPATVHADVATDVARSWEASLVLNGNGAYSYSCLSDVPEADFIGLAWETVLPHTHNSYLRPKASANNVLFTRIPKNFTSGDIILSPSSSVLKLDDSLAPTATIAQADMRLQQLAWPLDLASSAVLDRLAPTHHHSTIRKMADSAGLLLSGRDAYRSNAASTPLVRVTAYGADPTGHHDSTKAFAAAMATVFSHGSGKAMADNVTDLGGVVVDLEGGA